MSNWLHVCLSLGTLLPTSDIFQLFAWGFYDYLGSMNLGHKHEWGLPEDDKFSGETFSSPLLSPKIETVSFVSCLFCLGRLISHLSSQREYSSLGSSSTRDLLLNLLLGWALDCVLPLHTLQPLKGKFKFSRVWQKLSGNNWFSWVLTTQHLWLCVSGDSVDSLPRARSVKYLKDAFKYFIQHFGCFSE